MKELIEFFGFWTVLVVGLATVVGLAIAAILSYKASVELGKFQQMMPSEKCSAKIMKELRGSNV